MKTLHTFYGERLSNNNCLPRHHHHNIAREKPALFMILLPPLFGKSLTIAKSYGFSYIFFVFCPSSLPLTRHLKEFFMTFYYQKEFYSLFSFSPCINFFHNHHHQRLPAWDGFIQCNVGKKISRSSIVASYTSFLFSLSFSTTCSQ